MYKKFSKNIVLFFMCCVMSSCVPSPDGYLKKSANNKIFDNKGFSGKKRLPTYNRKYIEKAKQNARHSSFDEELDGDVDEDQDEYNDKKMNASYNKKIYRNMADMEESDDRENSNVSNVKKRKNKQNDQEYYPSLYRARKDIDARHYESEDKMRMEISEIKEMLEETKRHLAKQKCPSSPYLEDETSEKEVKMTQHVQPSAKPKPAILKSNKDKKAKLPQNKQQKKKILPQTESMNSDQDMGYSTIINPVPLKAL